ncbi:MAG: hypothetical protein GY925_24120 [Actinomycetia bacterium]|nr:hypothetical protein [Actinomycetes bacterium]
MKVTVVRWLGSAVLVLLVIGCGTSEPSADSAESSTSVVPTITSDSSITDDHAVASVPTSTPPSTTTTIEDLPDDIDELRLAIGASLEAGSMRYTIDTWAVFEGAASKRTILNGSFDAVAQAGTGTSNATLRGATVEIIERVMDALERTEDIDDRRSDAGDILVSASEPIVDYRHIDGTSWLATRDGERNWLELDRPVPLSPFDLLEQIGIQLIEVTRLESSDPRVTYEIVLHPPDMEWFGPFMTEFIEPLLYSEPSSSPMTGSIVVGTDERVAQIYLDVGDWWVSSDPRIDPSEGTNASIGVVLTAYGTVVEVESPR